MCKYTVQWCACVHIFDWSNPKVLSFLPTFLLPLVSLTHSANERTNTCPPPPPLSLFKVLLPFPTHVRDTYVRTVYFTNILLLLGEEKNDNREKVRLRQQASVKSCSSYSTYTAQTHTVLTWVQCSQRITRSYFCTVVVRTRTCTRKEKKKERKIAEKGLHLEGNCKIKLSYLGLPREKKKSSFLPSPPPLTVHLRKVFIPASFFFFLLLLHFIFLLYSSTSCLLFFSYLFLCPVES